MVKIATWNINSVRLRAPQVQRFLTEETPDVLCLQEIKCAEHLFPHQVFEELGYTHRAVHGQKYYRETAPQWSGRLPNTEWNSARILSLPLFPTMSESDVCNVVAAIKDTLAYCRAQVLSS